MLAAACLAFGVNISVSADPTDLQPVPLSPTGDQGGGNHNHDGSDDGHPKAPVLMPVLYLDGHTLTAASGTLGSTINILDEDGDVVFTTFVYIEGDITLPSTLSGTYTIEVIRGSQTFVGEITL